MSGSYATYHDLENQSVFISGGGSGIGADLTKGFLAQGCKVAFIQRSDASAFVESCEKDIGRKPHFIKCDVTDIEALHRSLDEAAEVNGPVDVLVNNAAHDKRHTLDSLSVEEWDQMINVNLRHHFFAAQRVAPAMKTKGYGAIINYSSISYMMGNAGYPAYASSKAGITALTRSLARELGPDGIRVNAVMPGWVLTDRQMELWADPESLKAHLTRQCLQEHLYGDDMIGGTLFLASKASRMMTGQALVIDGGVVTTG